MADEPSNAELAWRLESIQRQLAELVGRPEYNARQESAERRFGDLAADIEAMGRRIDGHEKDHQASHLSWRTIVYTAVPATAVALAAILAQLWIGVMHK